MNDGTLTVKQLRRIQKALGTVPFARLIGIELEEIGSGTATLTVKVRKELTQNPGRGSWRGHCLFDRYGNSVCHNHASSSPRKSHYGGPHNNLFASSDSGAPQSPGQGREGWQPSFRGFRRSFLRRLKPNSDST
jgi:hypothetical protein